MATGNNNAEAAMEWVFGHMEDPDFNDPLPDPAAAAPAAAAAAAAAAADPEKVGRWGCMHAYMHVYVSAAALSDDGAAACKFAV